MIFISGTIYAKVWDVKKPENGKYLSIQISTSEKEDDGTYTYSRWFPRVVGGAVEKLKGIKSGDRIIIKKAKFSNVNKQVAEGEYRTFFNFTIFDAEVDNSFSEKADGEPKTKSAEAPKTKPANKPSPAPSRHPVFEEEECPW